jgi:hypothetical protein
MDSDWQSTHRGSANQGIRRSQRIAPTGSLFVTANETESESSDEDDHEASPDKHTTMNAAPEIIIDNLVLLPDHYENQSPIEEHYRTEMPQEGHPMEQESLSSTPHTTIPVVNEQDERTGIQPMQVLHVASNAQAHPSPGTNTQDQAAEDLEYIERQPEPESPHHSLVNHSHQEATNPLSDEFDFGEVFMHDLPTPQFFNDAFEATAGSYRQHSIDPDHTEPVQVLDGASNAQAHPSPGICWMWEHRADMNEAEGCCIERATASDYIHNQMSNQVTSRVT